MSRKRHLPDKQRIPTETSLVGPIEQSVLDRLEAEEKAKRTLVPIVERRALRKHPSAAGKKKCKVCGARIRGNVKNHNEGEYHQNALRKKS